MNACVQARVEITAVDLAGDDSSGYYVDDIKLSYGEALAISRELRMDGGPDAVLYEVGPIEVGGGSMPGGFQARVNLGVLQAHPP